ncbi:PAS domain-containing protein [Chitinispirillales bacterium ANBcel5]|nr:PAS domain-containing protein [Chitinispirillales bacterium ANBcel5]
MLTFYALLSLFSALICVSVAVFIFFKNSSSTQNKVFSALCISFSYWAFLEFLVRQAETAERARMWLSLKSLWPFSLALLLHFVVVFTRSRLSKNRFFLFAFIYLPTIFLSVLSYNTYNTIPTKEFWGWSSNPERLGYNFLFYISATVATVCLILLLRFYKHCQDTCENKNTKLIFWAISFPVITGILSEFMFLGFSVKIPELVNISFAFIALVIGFAVNRRDLFNVSTGLAASTIVETMSEGILVVNSKLEIEVINPMLLQTLKRDRSDLINKHCGCVLDFLSDYSSVSEIPNKKCSDKKLHLLRNDGEKFPALLSWSTIYAKDGNIVGTVFIIRDITEIEIVRRSLLKAQEELEEKVEERTTELTESNKMLICEIEDKQRAERHLKAEQERLSVTLSSIHDGVIATNKEGKVMLLNDAAIKMTGVELENAWGQNLEDVYEVYDITNDQLKRHFPKPQKSKDEEPQPNCYQIYSKDGTKRLISEMCAPISDTSGHFNGNVIVFSDVTKRKKIEEELFRARKLESMSILASGIANEFSTIFSNIVTNLFLSKVGIDPSSETCRLITTAEKAAFKASGLIKQLQVFASNNTPLKEQGCIRDLIETSVGFYMNGLNSDYMLDFAEDLYEVEMDKGQIDQVLNNLIINADQAMAEGGTVRISAQNHDTAENPVLGLSEGHFVKISIKDSGKGIPGDTLTRVFDPYFTTRENGIGLGLTMAYATIRNHGGQINIESEPGKGSVFHIFLPAIKPQPQQEDIHNEDNDYQTKSA